MDKETAKKLVRETLNNPFDRGAFARFAKEIFNFMDESGFVYRGNLIPDSFAPYIQTFERIGKYTDPEKYKIDVLIVQLKKTTSLERARTMQRNFIAWYLNGSRGGELKDAALVAFVSPEHDDWRFSLVKMDYQLHESATGRVKVKQELTPARRWSFLVGKNENTHTAQNQLIDLLQNDADNRVLAHSTPLLADFERAFNIEKVTKEFFNKYRDLFLWAKETLDETLEKENKIWVDFEAKNIETVNFAKKLVGQIVFLYFLQKKGWFGVDRDAHWGTGPKGFLRELFDGKHGKYQNFFNDILEPLFYEALRIDRSHDDDYYSKLNCRIPFLNGGLFDPIGNYDWVHTDILLPNELFSNSKKTKEGDVGTGILDIFDRYNFTVKEDEPLEKDVAIDPEMLGKVFENLLEVKDRKSKGTYYTPREIVHFMCQESLLNYLATELPSAAREDIETLIKHGETAVEHDVIYLEKLAANPGYKGKYEKSKLPESIERNAQLIDEKLATIRVCDPAVGSAAFLVGMMSEVVRTRNALTTYLGNRDRSVYNFKRHAIQNSLYGVDIDPGAVEIAKLRLWLSLVVDEEDMKYIKPLPNLDYKIVCGNSLLGVEKNLFNADLFKKLEELKPFYFNETHPVKKQEYKKQIDELISQITNGHKDFDFEVYFSEVFHEKDGFDVVIANPPYLSALEFSRTYGREKRKALNDVFQSAKGTYDLYILFIEKAIALLNQCGKLAFINPNKYLSAKYAQALREFILRNAKLDCLVDVSGIRIFDEVSVYPVLSFMSKSDGSSYSIKLVLPRIRQAEAFQLANYFVTSIQSEVLSSLSENIWGFLLSDKIDVLFDLIKGTKPLSQYGDINASTTAAESDDYSKWISEANQQGTLKVLNTGLIDSYVCLWGKSPITVNGKKLLTPYLSLKAVNERRKSMYKKPKVIYAKLAKACEAFLDVSGEYAALNTNFFYNPREGVSLKYIAAYSNSKLFMFFYNQFFGALRMGGGFYQFQAPQLRVIPCRMADHKISLRIEGVVDKIFALTKSTDYLENRQIQIKVQDYEKQIDQLVYELFGLTEQQIAIVEGKEAKIPQLEK